MSDKLYFCNICNYSTSDRANYSRHNRTKKHQQKVIKANNIVVVNCKQPARSHLQPQKNCKNEKFFDTNCVCSWCGNTYKRQDSLTRHRKICPARIEEITAKAAIDDAKDIVIKTLQQQLDNQKRIYEDDIERYKEDLIFYKKLVKDAGVGTSITNNTQNTQNNMSVQSLIVSRHSDAPALKMATSDILELQLESDNNNDNAELILYYYRRKDIAAFIGDGIVSAYKKKNPNDQSLWATDVSRLTMFIKKVLNGDESVWISDKKGVKTREYLIDPLMDKVDEIMEEYVKDKHAYIKMKKDIYPKLDDDLEYMNLAAKLSNEIRHKKYHDDILRYIAPRFSYMKKEKIDG